VAGYQPVIPVYKAKQKVSASGGYHTFYGAVIINSLTHTYLFGKKSLSLIINGELFSKPLNTFDKTGFMYHTAILYGIWLYNMMQYGRVEFSQKEK
jgi:hypothetical protein